VGPGAEEVEAVEVCGQVAQDGFVGFPLHDGIGGGGWGCAGQVRCKAVVELGAEGGVEEEMGGEAPEVAALAGEAG
jgi:hypothetical protein